MVAKHRKMLRKSWSPGHWVGQTHERDTTFETHNLLTIATPTGLPEKPAFRNDDSGTYAIYHRADWKVVAKILVEDVIRPAGWSRNADTLLSLCLSCA